MRRVLNEKKLLKEDKKFIIEKRKTRGSGRKRVVERAIRREEQLSSLFVP